MATGAPASPYHMNRPCPATDDLLDELREQELAALTQYFRARGLSCIEEDE